MLADPAYRTFIWINFGLHPYTAFNINGHQISFRETHGRRNINIKICIKRVLHKKLMS